MKMKVKRKRSNGNRTQNQESTKRHSPEENAKKEFIKTTRDIRKQICRRAQHAITSVGAARAVSAVHEIQFATPESSPIDAGTATIVPKAIKVDPLKTPVKANITEI